MARYMNKIDGMGNKSKPKAKKVVVKQATIDKIKGMGMTAAIKKAGTSSNAEFVEGVKRMYGARRLSAAKGKAADSRIQKPSLRQPYKRTKAGGSSSKMK